MDQALAVKVLAALLLAALAKITADYQRGQRDVARERPRSDEHGTTTLVTVTQILSEVKELRDDMGVNHGEVIGAIGENQSLLNDQLRLYRDALKHMRNVDPPAA